MALCSQEGIKNGSGAAEKEYPKTMLLSTPTAPEEHGGRGVRSSGAAREPASHTWGERNSAINDNT